MSTRLRPARLRWPPAPVATGPSRFPRAQPPQVAAHIGGSSAPPLKTSVTFGDKVDGIGQRQRADPGGCRKGPPGGARWNRRGGSPGPAAGSAVGSARLGAAFRFVQMLANEARSAVSQAGATRPTHHCPACRSRYQAHRSR